GGLDLFLAHGYPRLDGLARQQEHGNLAHFWRRELALVLVVVFFEFRLVRFRSGEQLVVIGREELNDPRLLAIGMREVGQELGWSEAGEERIRQLLSHLVAASRRQITVLGDTVLAQQRAKGVA